MTTVSLNNTQVLTYSGAVIHDYIVTDLFGTRSMHHFDMRDTEELNQPIVIHGESVYKDDDTDHTEQIAAFTGADIPLFTPLKAYNRVKKRSIDERPSLRHLENLGESHGKSIGNGKTTSILDFLQGAASGFGNTTSAGATPTPSSVKDAIKLIAANMDENEVDAMDRFAMLKSSAFYELADQDGVMSVDFGGQANRQFIGGNADVIRYLNFTIVNCGIGFGIDYSASPAYSDRIAETGLGNDLSSTIGIFWQKRSWAMRDQALPNGAVDWIARLQVWQALSRYQFGLKTLDDGTSGPGTTGIWEMTAT